MKITTRQLKRIIREEAERNRFGQTGRDYIPDDEVDFDPDATAEEYVQHALYDHVPLSDALGDLSDHFAMVFGLDVGVVGRRIANAIAREFSREERL